MASDKVKIAIDEAMTSIDKAIADLEKSDAATQRSSFLSEMNAVQEGKVAMPCPPSTGKTRSSQIVHNVSFRVQVHWVLSILAERLDSLREGREQRENGYGPIYYEEQYAMCKRLHEAAGMHDHWQQLTDIGRQWFVRDFIAKKNFPKIAPLIDEEQLGALYTAFPWIPHIHAMLIENSKHIYPIPDKPITIRLEASTQ